MLSTRSWPLDADVTAAWPEKTPQKRRSLKLRSDMDRRLATAVFTERRDANRALAALRGLEDAAVWDVELGDGDGSPTLQVPVELIQRHAYVPKLIADAGGVLEAIQTSSEAVTPE